jgi:hypothetical protein
MRFIIMHKTNAGWEAGAIPSLALIARVGNLIGELAKAGALLSGEGLRPSSEGVRLKFARGVRKISKGPFEGGNELPAGFSIVRAASIDDAIEWASQQARVVGDVEIDIRPVTEPWDIGMTPKPENVATRRYMALRKATAESEAGVSPSPAQRAQMARLINDTDAPAVHVTTVNMQPSARGRRYKNSADGLRVTDGPFTESKELIAGYVMVSAESLNDASAWAARYLETVEADEVDLRELEDG